MTTTPPGGTPAPRRRRLARLGPTALSAVAVLISVAALVVAVLAYARGSGDSTRAVRPAAETTAAPSAAGTTPGATRDPAVETEPADGDAPQGTDAPLPSGGAPYTVVKQDVRVTLTGGVNVNRALDLDQPLVNADPTRSDASLSTFRDPARLEFTTVNVAEARSPDVTPDECASNIQLSPTDQEVELSQDLVLCTVTNGVGAVNEPSRPKMARVVVDSVGPDGTTTLTITTWEIPR